MSSSDVVATFTILVNPVSNIENENRYRIESWANDKSKRIQNPTAKAAIPVIASKPLTHDGYGLVLVVIVLSLKWFDI